MREDEKATTDKSQGAQGLVLDWSKFNWQQKVDVAEFSLEKSQKRPVSVGNN
jgi:hypothetical protein